MLGFGWSGLKRGPTRTVAASATQTITNAKAIHLRMTQMKHASLAKAFHCRASLQLALSRFIAH
jgi:hypothetical protein